MESVLNFDFENLGGLIEIAGPLIVLYATYKALAWVFKGFWN